MGDQGWTNREGNWYRNLEKINIRRILKDEKYAKKIKMRNKKLILQKPKNNENT